MFQDPKIINIVGKVGKEESFSFSYDDKIKLVTKIVSSCGCTGVRNISKEKKIVAKYLPADIPIHLKEQGHYETIQTITVYYQIEDGTEVSEILTFKATIYR